jgi:serine/threonine-protein kinase
MTPTLLNNRYRIIRALGAGGFGNTFLAEDSYMPSRRQCVIKQLKPVTHDPLAHQQTQERFQREAAVLEELGEGHSQIPRLYAYFSEGGQFHLVQEWIEGNTLTQQVEQQGKFSEAEVKDILVKLLPVLEYIHNQRTIHRDIKPDNVIIRKRDNLPVLIDFGAVKEVVTTVVNTPGNAMHSLVIGTPGYMSSEQASGRPTFASDLYSLGLTAVFLLTGKTPQQLESDAQTGEILWRQEAANVHSNLASVIDRAIRFYPRDRFASATDMLNALRSTQAPSIAQTVAVSPARYPAPPAPGLPYTSPVNPAPVVKQPGGQNTQVIGLIVAAVLLGAGLAVAAIQNQRQPTVEEPITQEIPTAPEEPVTQQPPTTSAPPAVRPSPNPVRETPPPVVAPSPAPIVESSPTEEITPSPALPESPAPAPPENQEAPPPVTSLMGFPVGTPESQIRGSLGNPTKVSGGLWNTRAVLYENYVPDRVSFGYLFDRNTGRLRQSEAAFASSVEPEVMVQVVNGMLGGGASREIEEGVERVHQRQTKQYSFQTSGLKGVVERNSSDRIYIGIWDANLH